MAMSARWAAKRELGSVDDAGGAGPPAETKRRRGASTTTSHSSSTTSTTHSSTSSCGLAAAGKHVHKLREQLSREERVREGVCRLLSACTQREQALHAAQALLACNARIQAFVEKLRRAQGAELVRRASLSAADDDNKERSTCKAKVCLSDIRIPLMWKDTDHFQNKGEFHRFAVFCLLKMDTEVFDTKMITVDRTVTDILFDSVAVFPATEPGFELQLEVYSCCLLEDLSIASTPRRLASRLSSSVGRSTGRRVLRQRSLSDLSRPAPRQPPVRAPKFHLLARVALTLEHVYDGFRTHDLTITGKEGYSYWLPLYGNVCCRLVAQPACMTEDRMTGFLIVQDGDKQDCKLFCVLIEGKLLCFATPQSRAKGQEPVFIMPVNKDTRMRLVGCEDGVDRLQVRNMESARWQSHTLLAHRSPDLLAWLEALRQHVWDLDNWKQCCNKVMAIEELLPRAANLQSKPGSSLYYDMDINSPSKNISPLPNDRAQQPADMPGACGSLATVQCAGTEPTLEAPGDAADANEPGRGRSSSGIARPFGKSAEKRPAICGERRMSLDGKLAALKHRILQWPTAGTPRKIRTAGGPSERRVAVAEAAVAGMGRPPLPPRRCTLQK
ncbi:rhotekin-2 [Petromyzon marinus]|uniref:rhotekin-2 n=1 Tax=Petromyzon marinus TaxID=7757 RepID=UPI003F70530F